MAAIFDDIEDIDSLRRLVIKEILFPLVATATRRKLLAKTVVDFDPEMIWLVDSGEIGVECRGRELLVCQPEDIIGPWLNSVGPLALATRPAQGSELVGFSTENVARELRADPKKAELWCSFQMALNYQSFAALTEAKTLSAPPVPEYRHYGAGEVILAEGEPAREVFVLNDGRATVSVRGARVGEVRKDEVFGALGALSGGVRTATVVADEMCDCTVFSKESFQDLLRLNPKLMTKLFEDFGRALSDLNDSVSRAAGTKWSNLF